MNYRRGRCTNVSVIKSKIKARDTAAAWNASHRVGTLVSVTLHDGRRETARTVTEAAAIAEVAAIRVDHPEVRGYYALSNVEPMEVADAA